MKIIKNLKEIESFNKNRLQEARSRRLQTATVDENDLSDIINWAGKIGAGLTTYTQQTYFFTELVREQRRLTVHMYRKLESLG